MDFVPPFCANPDCLHHYHDRKNPYRDFRSWGSFSTLTFGKVPRYRCKACGHTFSVQTFRVDYWLKRRYSYDDLARRLSSCESLRAIGRAWGVCGQSVQNRIARAARQVIALEARLTSVRKPSEDLAADGFESWCHSQYFPNNVHILVGKDSQFVYAFDLATIRRKGLMTEGQKKRRAELEKTFRADPKAIKKSFARILDAWLAILSDSGRPSLSLWTDEKREYRQAMASSPCVSALLFLGRLSHKRISSRTARTRANPLFAVNYLDRELRKDLHEHVRETTCGAKDVNCQMERLSLYLFHHNHRKDYRIRHRDRRSHAEVAGYDPGMMEVELSKIWIDRAWLTHTELSTSERDTWLRLRPSPLRKGPENRQKHVWGWIQGGLRSG